MVSEEYTAPLARSVVAAAQSIADVRKEDSFVFLTFSDLHMRTAEEESVQKLLAALEGGDVAASLIYAGELEGGIEHVRERQTLTLENMF